MQSEHEKRPARKGPDVVMTIGIIALIVAAIVVLGGFLNGDMMGRGFMGPASVVASFLALSWAS